MHSSLWSTTLRVCWQLQRRHDQLRQCCDPELIYDDQRILTLHQHIRRDI
jgi:hypothetical protein